MKKKAVSGILLTLLLIGMLTLAFSVQTVNARTIIVPDDYPTIREAVNAASEGDTIYVRAGVYYENVVVDKSISLLGEDRRSIIDGDWSGTIIEVISDGVNISGFTIQRSSGWPDAAGIYLNNVRYCNISKNNIVSNHRYGIWLQKSANNSIFGNNIASNRYYGIHLWGSSNNSIFRNNIANNWYYGIELYHSSKNSIFRNNVTNHKRHGIVLGGGSSNNSIFGNNIVSNGNGIYLLYSSNNTIYHNNFVDNARHVYDRSWEDPWYSPSINTWDNGYPSGGNYWSDHNPPDIYTGPYQNETGRDGIGDIPYIIDGNNTDRYPLIYPYGYVPSPDVNDDGMVDLFDVAIAALAFGSRPGDPNWNPQADLYLDGLIDIFDLVVIGINYGKRL